MLHSKRVSYALALFIAAAGSVSLHSQPSAMQSPGISNGYILGTSKVGINDTVYAGDQQFREARFNKFQSIGTNVKMYPTGWNQFEAANSPTSALPNLACPAGFEMVPKDAATKAAKGYHKYRCLNTAEIQKFDTLFREDRERGIETAGGAYAPPVQYSPACTPAPWPVDQPFPEGCVPADSAMDDYEDYVNFLAHYWDGVNDAGQDDGSGKITHFIVWNEFQSGRWFNYSWVVPWWTHTLSPQQIAALAQKYRDLLVRAHTAFARHRNQVRPAVMLYVSLDAQFNHYAGVPPNPFSTPPNPGAPYHINTQVALEALWAALGTSIDWSIAIHPYQDPTANLADWINYAKLGFLVDYQAQALLTRGVSNPLNRPQTVIFPNEQGWPHPPVDHQTRAVYMCQAHDLSMRLPTVLASTHANFQVGQDCATGALHDDPYGLIPASAGCDLGLVDTLYIPEWFAYRSMAPSNWGRNNSHGCCSALGLGCVAPVNGSVDVVTFENGEWVVKGWACSPGSNESITVHLYGLGPAGGGGVLMAGAAANLPNEPAVSAACRSAGKSFRFQIPLTPWLQYHGVPLYVHGISPYGAPNDLLPGSGVYKIP